MSPSHARELFVFGQRFDPKDVFENMDFEVQRSLTPTQKRAIAEALETTILNYIAMSSALPDVDEEPAAQWNAGPAGPPTEQLERAIAGEAPRPRGPDIQAERRRRMRGSSRGRP